MCMLFWHLFVATAVAVDSSVTLNCYSECKWRVAGSVASSSAHGKDVAEGR